MGSQPFFFEGVASLSSSLKLACAGAGSTLWMCCYGDLSKVASTNRKEGLKLSHPENYLGNSLNKLRRTGPRSIPACFCFYCTIIHRMQLKVLYIWSIEKQE